MEIYLIVAQTLATYVLTCVFLYSSGPWGYLEDLRRNRSMKDFGLLECFLCTSFWVALVITLLGGGDWRSFFIVWGVSYVIDQLVIAYKTK